MKFHPFHYHLPKPTPSERDRTIAHFPSLITKQLTIWLWEEGPITTLDAHRLAFWERLHITAPKTARPYFYLINTILFSSQPFGLGKKYGECEHYAFNGLSPHLLMHPRTGICYEATTRTAVWRQGYWWAVHEGRDNSDTAIKANRMQAPHH